MSNSSIWSIDRTQSGATTPSQSGPGNNSNERVLCILQSSSITGASPSDCLMSYPGYWFGGWGGLLLCRDAVGVFYSPNRLGYVMFNNIFIYQPLHMNRMWRRVFFFSIEFNRFEFRVFFLLDQLPYYYSPTISERKIVGFISFFRVLMLCEM